MQRSGEPRCLFNFRTVTTNWVKSFANVSHYFITVTHCLLDDLKQQQQQQKQKPLASFDKSGFNVPVSVLAKLGKRAKLGKGAFASLGLSISAFTELIAFLSRFDRDRFYSSLVLHSFTGFSPVRSKKKRKKETVEPVWVLPGFLAFLMATLPKIGSTHFFR